MHLQLAPKARANSNTSSSRKSSRCNIKNNSGNSDSCGNIGSRCHLPSDEQEQQQEEYLSDWPADVESAQKGLEGAPEEHGHPEVSQCTVRCIQLNIRDHDALHYAKYTEDDTLNKPLQFKLLADVPACMDCPLQPLQYDRKGSNPSQSFSANDAHRASGPSPNSMRKGPPPQSPMPLPL